MYIGVSKIGEKGLFSKDSYTKDQIIYRLTGQIFDCPLRETIHIGNNVHIYDQFGAYINHSFEPNICIVGNNIMAKTDIEADTELCFDYNESELLMASPFMIGDRLVQGKKF